MDYLKIGKATHLEGKDYKLYRKLEMLPGVLAWGTLLGLIILSYFKPVWVAYFIIAFDIYWLLLVLYLGLHLISSYRKVKRNMKIDWEKKCKELPENLEELDDDCLAKQGTKWEDVIHLLVLPTYAEGLDVLRPGMDALLKDGYPPDKMIVVFAIEGRTGEEGRQRAETIKKEYGHYFRDFLITVHPDDIPGELKGKGANQAWAAQAVKKEIVDKQGLDYYKILVSIFDADTVVEPGYFFCLTYKFLTVENPYRASYQPVPVYHNNMWEAPFFARVAASSNTFWQMMQQIRQEKLATYSSHSMTWKALVDVNFWSTTMVSEDSRIFWHCLLHYNGDYRVEPLYFSVSMDATMDRGFLQTARSLYKQQRRWGWGVENVPYLIFNTKKRWSQIKKGKLVGLIGVQLYGFHSWATNALIIGVVGWMPVLIGGDKFFSTVLSGNLPYVTRNLMTIAMVGLVLSAIVSTLLLPKMPKKYGPIKYLTMILQWIVLPFTIIIFGAIPALDAQTRLMFGKYMGFWHTPKKR